MKKTVLIFLLLLFGCTSTEEDIYGCTNQYACNFNPDANIFDDTCWYTVDECECSHGEGASVDMCGICDTDASNDCTQD